MTLVLQLGDEKVTLNHLVAMYHIYIYIYERPLAPAMSRLIAKKFAMCMDPPRICLAFQGVLGLHPLETNLNKWQQDLILDLHKMLRKNKKDITLW